MTVFYIYNINVKVLIFVMKKILQVDLICHVFVLNFNFFQIKC